MIFKKIGNMENVEVICHYYMKYSTLTFSNNDMHLATTVT